MKYRFVVGEKIIVKDHNPDYTKAPKYARRKVGIVRAVRGPFTDPKDNPSGRPAVYSIVFDRREIFPDTSGDDKVVVDLYEDWLEKVK